MRSEEWGMWSEEWGMRTEAWRMCNKTHYVLMAHCFITMLHCFITFLLPYSIIWSYPTVTFHSIHIFQKLLWQLRCSLFGPPVYYISNPDQACFKWQFVNKTIKLRNEEWGVRNVGCGMWNVECGVWNVECGMWGVDWGMRHVEHVEHELWSMS